MEEKYVLVLTETQRSQLIAFLLETHITGKQAYALVELLMHIRSAKKEE